MHIVRKGQNIQKVKNITIIHNYNTFICVTYYYSSITDFKRKAPDAYHLLPCRNAMNKVKV